MTSRRLRLLVLAGGMLGTGLRYAAFQIWFHVRGTFPVTTLVVNALGALALGIVVELSAEHPRGQEIRAFAGVGVLGGFTTFSAVAVELAEYGIDGDPATGAGYAGAMVISGVVAAAVGLAVGRALRGLRGRRSGPSEAVA